MSSNALGNSGGRLYSFGTQPVLIDCNFVVDNTNANGVTSLRGQGVNRVYMNCATTPSAANPNPAAGYALIQLANNYNRYLGGFRGFAGAPVTGSPLAIDASDAALTAGVPYQIVTVGVGPAGQVTIAPVADVSGSLASKYFKLYDSYGNTFVIWFSVSGVGSAPLLGPAALPGQRGLQYVQQTLTSGATAANITTALDLTIKNLDSGVQGVKSFTCSGGGGATLTCVSTITQPVSSIPQDGSTVIPESGPSIPIKFTITSGSATAGSIWTDGSGHLYTVTTTVSSGTTLLTSGIGTPIGSTLTFISGPGASTALTFSAAIGNYSTGFTFAQTVSDTNLQDWNGVGLPRGITPAVGASFVATHTGAGASTGTVKALGVSGISSIEVIGDPNLTLAPQPQGGSPNVGGWILIQFLGATNSGTTTLIPTAPAAGSLVNLSFYVDVKQSPSNTNTH